MLKNGDWLAPVTLWSRNKISAPLRDAYRELDAERMAHAFVSTDRGATWQRRGGVRIPETDFDEHMLVELRDGRIWLLARSARGIAESFSADGGRTWSEPKVRFPHVSSRFFIRRLASGNLLLVRHGHLNELVSYPDGFQGTDGTLHVMYDHDRANAREILMARFTEANVLAGGFAGRDAQARMRVHKAMGPSAAP